MSWETDEGSPRPLGVTWVPEEKAYNFALYSRYASRMTLLLYRKSDFVHPANSFDFDHLRNKSGQIWHCRIPAARIGKASFYAYRVDGPAPEGPYNWHQFDPQKVLLDPYARGVFFPPEFDPAAAARPGSNAGRAPLGMLSPCRTEFHWGPDPRPRHEADLVIYELHVRSFTANPNSAVSADKRGTFGGLVEKIPYLKELGVTAVELMPVFQFEPGRGDFWGYMPLSFFAPHNGYYAEAQRREKRREFRKTVHAFHEAGIEVILDVVYNHTCEGGRGGPVYSFKGIDASTYYMQSQDPDHPFEDFSGTGNTLNCNNHYVRTMILDSLRYWAKDLHVDGFRFDLASTFTRNADGSLNLGDPPIIGGIGDDPDLSNVRLIAEPWDAAGAYELGRCFPGLAWLQWNDRFRDDIRRFVRGDAGMTAAAMLRMYGSDDLFSDGLPVAFHPYQSVNLVTCHDGFTLYDLVSYTRKRNEANGHGNTDGLAENFSTNCGWEGDEDVPPAVVERRKRLAKSFAALLLLSNGTPMLRAGDEFLNSQGGNNNPYNQDNPTGWVDWNGQTVHADVLRFFKRMIAFRKDHRSLCRSRFWRDDIRWYEVGEKSFSFFLAGVRENDADLYVLIHMGDEDSEFHLMQGRPDEWFLVLDTSLPSPRDICDPGAETRLDALTYLAKPKSVVVLVRGPAHPAEEPRS